MQQQYQGVSQPTQQSHLQYAPGVEGYQSQHYMQSPNQYGYGYMVPQNQISNPPIAPYQPEIPYQNYQPINTQPPTGYAQQPWGAPNLYPQPYQSLAGSQLIYYDPTQQLQPHVQPIPQTPPMYGQWPQYQQGIPQPVQYQQPYQPNVNIPQQGFYQQQQQQQTQQPLQQPQQQQQQQPARDTLTSQESSLNYSLSLFQKPPPTDQKKLQEIDKTIQSQISSQISQQLSGSKPKSAKKQPQKSGSLTYHQPMDFFAETTPQTQPQTSPQKQTQPVQPPKQEIPPQQQPVLEDYQRNLQQNKSFTFFQFNSEKIFRYNPQDQLWINLPNKYNYMLQEHFRVAELPDNTFFISGGQNQGETSNLCVRYVDGVFHALTGMNQARDAHATIYNNGFVYVFGGQKNGQSLRNCERYNLQENRWHLIESMNEEKTLASACNYGTNYIYVFGGWSEKSQTELDQIERYVISENRFEAVEFKLHEQLQNPFVVQISANEVLILGGWNDKNKDSNDVRALNLENGILSDRPDFNEDDKGWGFYPPFYANNKLYLFITGEEEDRMPDVIEYSLTNKSDDDSE
eukprot:TRINITY_DN3174_c0_g1_i8.p1 TRINITY_DN3174_c0_g1~~TRINITY_DN3174_c0_g1_i8.p1  ORF type:complete len:572 (+),score=72.26 TRINITY_DN3174_c0_g1_i8:69-1784(+)